MKISILGCGLRTPLLLSGLARSARLSAEIVLYDTDPEQAELMAQLGRAAEPESTMQIRVARTAPEAIDGCDFVICSIRPGGMEARARDERICLDLEFAGQETVGPAGAAMAWRTIPAVLHYAGLMEKYAARGWMVNFTNPAGVVTQAIHSASAIRAVGICDTPVELILRIALSFGVPLGLVKCEYLGLNHLGFVSKVDIGNVDRTAELLQDDARLSSLYPAPLFPPELIRELGAIPTEYVFFYYRPRLARRNQEEVGRTRGEELLDANCVFYTAVRHAVRNDGAAAGLRLYVRYLNRRNASYLQLEGAAASASSIADPDWDPFAAITGYHRIAVQTIEALSGATPAELILNVLNQGVMGSMSSDDVVEIGCFVDEGGIRRPPKTKLPAPVVGLVEATKAYERTLIAAAVARDHGKMIWALTQNPLVGDWDEASRLVAHLLP